MNIYNLFCSIDMIHFDKESMSKIYLGNNYFIN